jgi:MSHA biogenesis protein MshK
MPVVSAPAAPPAQAAAPAAEAPKLKVTSIVYNSKAPTAIINGQVVGVGEVLEGAKIVAIAPRSVEVLVDGRRLTLRL